MPKWYVYLLALGMVWGSVSPAGAHDPFDEKSLRKYRIPEQLEGLSDDISKLVIEDLQKFLDRELSRLKKYTPETRESLEKKLEAQQAVIRDQPENARAHFEMGELYDQLDDGAAAIIHTRIAERLFLMAKDVKGTAEARRNLRHYFKKYDFKPEDFVLKPAE